jgi:hypothetical protein
LDLWRSAPGKSTISGQATKGAVDTLAGEVRSLAGDLGDVRAELADHEARLREVERGRWPLRELGAIVALIAAAAAVVALFAQ